jgi:hypothetical protein
MFLDIDNVLVVYKKKEDEEMFNPEAVFHLNRICEMVPSLSRKSARRGVLVNYRVAKERVHQGRIQIPRVYHRHDTPHFQIPTGTGPGL